MLFFYPSLSVNTKEILAPINMVQRGLVIDIFLRCYNLYKQRKKEQSIGLFVTEKEMNILLHAWMI